MSKATAYCMKEKKKVTIKDPKYELNKNNRPIVRGTCNNCGTKVYGILASKDAPADLRAKMGKKGSASRKSKKSRKSRSRKSRSRKSRS